MHVAINAQIVSPVGGYRQAGVSGYAEQIARRLPALAPADRWTIYAAPGITPERLALQPNTRLHVSRLPTTKPIARIWWEQLVAPVALWRTRPDLLLCPLNVVPLWAPCPTVVTIHDLAFLRYPEYFPPAKQRYLAAFTRLSAHRARHIITVTEATKRDVVQLLGVPATKITAIINGLPDDLPLPSQAEIAAFRRRVQLPERFLLFVGTLEPRKNIGALLQAYHQVRAEVDMPLVVVGGKGWMYAPIFALHAALGLGDRVLFPGFVAPADLALWYSAATAFVYPSLYEGLGLPPIEAMHYGTPVVTSNVSSLPEVVGDAALTVDPNDVAALAAALVRVTQDAPLREELQRRGRAHAAQFRWHRTAERTLALLRSLA